MEQVDRMDRSPVAVVSRFLDLPDELKLEVVRNLDQRRDLLNLCLTCRTLEDVVLSKLYADVQVDVPQSKSMGWNTGGLPVFRSEVIRSIQTLSIRNGCMDLRDPVYNRRRRSDAGSVEGYISDILARIPPNQLSSFSYLHKAPLTSRNLDLLANAHGSRLRELRMYELETLHTVGLTVPQNLTWLECRSINDGAAWGQLVRQSSASLQTLRFGQEKVLVENYRNLVNGFLNQIVQPGDSFLSVLALQDIPNLQEIALFGIDITPFVPQSIPDALFFCNLRRLTLESCGGSADFLDTMADAFHHAQIADAAGRRMPKLKEFLLRNEAPTTRLKDCLIRFLSSFSGLEKLSLLFENATFSERCSALICGHGPTLKTLVLECRTQPREHLGLDSSRPFGAGGYSQELWEQSINDVCRLCPNLVELGMGFPWNDEIVRIRKTNLPQLVHLRTMHIRNFPESQLLSQLGDYSIKEYAIKFVEWNFPALVGGARPVLETLALGPTLYESRWKSSTTRRQPPEFLRTHHFCLDWAQTRFGRWSAMITSISEKCMEELRGESPLGGVFEQVWLR